MKRKPILVLGGVAAALGLCACDPLELDKKAEQPQAATPAPAPAPPTPAAPTAPAAPAPAAPAPAVAAPATPAPAPAAPAGEQEVIKPTFPKPMFIGTPVPAGDIPNLESGAKPVLEFTAPKGSTNVAQGKKVSSSDPAPIIGDLTLVTDGDADGSDGCFVELAPGKQYVQIDLEAEYNIHKVLLWHYHKNSVVYFDVIVQASNDPEFKTGVTTLYNNDHDNSSGMGTGPDKAWVETNHGRLVDGKGAKARYVRLWSNGNTASELNHYCEVAVYGTK